MKRLQSSPLYTLQTQHLTHLNNHIIQVGHFPGATNAYDVAGDGNLAVVSDRDFVLSINITNKALPVLLDSISTPGWAFSLAVKDNYAYVSCYTKGMIIIDYSNPVSLNQVNSFTLYNDSNFECDSEHVEINNTHAYLKRTTELRTNSI